MQIKDGILADKGNNNSPKHAYNGMNLHMDTL